MTGKVVANFDNPVAAELAHNYLADYGLHPLLQNEEVGATFAGMSNLVGGVRLLVPDDEEAVAKDLLANRPKSEDDIPADAIAAAGVRVTEDPTDSLEESSADKNARRAFRTMVLGLIPPLLPIQFYGLYLLMGIGQDGSRLSRRYRWTPLWCILLFVPVWLVIGVGLATLLNATYDPNSPHWRTETLTISKSAGMGVEFPNPPDAQHLRNRTPAGDSRETRLHAVQGDCQYFAYVDVPINPPDVPLPDESLKSFLKGEEAAGRKVVSDKWVVHRTHTGIEYRTTFTDDRRRTWFGRWQVFLVDNSFVAIGLEGLSPDVTDDFRAKRFFRSFQLP